MEQNIKKQISHKGGFSYFLFFTRAVSSKYLFIKWCFKNRATINYEINRHFKYYPYMIHPFSVFRLFIFNIL